jgi:hypothetical protein
MINLLASLSILATGLFYVNDPVVTLRKDPAIHSKIQSQAIFSEDITVEKEQDDWVYITTSDHVSGWVPFRSLVQRERAYVGTVKVPG